METHILNAGQQRFEPVSKDCLFCKNKTRNKNMEDNLFTPVYRTKDRSNYVVYRNVKFNEIKIGVPRCESCKNIDSNVSIITNLLIFVSVFTTLILPIYLAVEFKLPTLGLVIALATTFGIMVLITMGLERGMLAMNNVYSKKDGSMRDPLIKEFLRGGWSLKRPTA
jgi:hypothetical protein